MPSSARHPSSGNGNWLEVFAHSRAREMTIRAQLRGTQGPHLDEAQRVAVIDGTHPDFEVVLQQILHSTHAESTLIVAFLDESAPPARKEEILFSLREGELDDVIEVPVSAIRWSAHCVKWEESLALRQVQDLNRSLHTTLESLRQDLAVVEKLQRARVPKRFAPIAGFNIAQRYLAGTRSGGDYLDLGLSRDQKSLSLVLTDSSSYGLSSHVLSALVRVSVALTRDDSKSPANTFALLREELLTTMGPKDRLAAFYGVLSLRDYVLRFIQIGHPVLYYLDSAQSQWRVVGAAQAELSVAPDVRAAPLEEQRLELIPGCRLLLLSDGVTEALGGVPAVLKVLEAHQSADAESLCTELIYTIKKGLESLDEMPQQDCTVALLDLSQKALRQVPKAAVRE